MNQQTQQAYRQVYKYTLKAVKSAIKEIDDSINDPQNVLVKDILIQRRRELESSLSIIISSEE